MPALRGMLERHHQVLRNFAKNNKMIIIVRDSNKAAFQHILEKFDGKHIMSKLENLKLNTLSKCKNAGLVGFPPPGRSKKTQRILNKWMTIKEMPQSMIKKHGKKKAKKMLQDAINKGEDTQQLRYKWYKENLDDIGYKVSSNKNSYVVTSKDGSIKGFFSDYDLHGMYKQNKRSKWKSLDNDAFDPYKKELNKDFDIDMINHNAQDAWEDTAKRVSLGIKPPVTVYLPNGKTIALTSQKEMINFYNKVLDVDLKKLYKVK